MKKLWFTADTHLGHGNILKEDYENRPFINVAEMDNGLIYAWNKVVGWDDIVYHLGDLTLKGGTSARHYLKRLKGNIKILGNYFHHDKKWLPKSHGLPVFNRPVHRYISRSRKSERKEGIVRPIEVLPPIHVLYIKNYFKGDKFADLPIVLCHFPIAAWDRKIYGSWHLHGHSHCRYEPKDPNDLILDVGIDNAYKLLGKYRPFSFEEVKEIMLSKSPILHGTTLL